MSIAVKMPRICRSPGCQYQKPSDTSFGSMTHWQPKRPFQGWRYLAAKDAPDDLEQGGEGFAELPAAFRRELADLGLL